MSTSDTFKDAVAKIEAQLNDLRHKLTTGIASGWADSSNTTATYKQKLEGAQRAINFVADGDFPKVKESLAEALRLKVTVDRLKGNMEDAAHNRKQSLVHLEDATKNLNIIANNMERGGSSSGRIGENVKLSAVAAYDQASAEKEAAAWIWRQSQTAYLSAVNKLQAQLSVVDKVKIDLEKSLLLAEELVQAATNEGETLQATCLTSQGNEMVEDVRNAVEDVADVLDQEALRNHSLSEIEEEDDDDEDDSGNNNEEEGLEVTDAQYPETPERFLRPSTICNPSGDSDVEAIDGFFETIKRAVSSCEDDGYDDDYTDSEAGSPPRVRRNVGMKPALFDDEKSDGDEDVDVDEKGLEVETSVGEKEEGEKDDGVEVIPSLLSIATGSKQSKSVSFDEALMFSPNEDAFVPVAASVSSDAIDSVIEACRSTDSLKDKEANKKAVSTLLSSRSADSSVKSASGRSTFEYCRSADSLDTIVIQKAIEAVSKSTEEIVDLDIEATKSAESVKPETEDNSTEEIPIEAVQSAEPVNGEVEEKPVEAVNSADLVEPEVENVIEPLKSVDSVMSEAVESLIEATKSIDSVKSEVDNAIEATKSTDTISSDAVKSLIEASKSIDCVKSEVENAIEAAKSTDSVTSKKLDGLIEAYKKVDSIKVEVENVIEASNSVDNKEMNGVGTTESEVHDDVEESNKSEPVEELLNEDLPMPINEEENGADVIVKAVSFGAEAINNEPPRKEIEKTKSNDSSQIVFTYSINTADELSIASDSSGGSCDDDSLNEKLGIDSSNNNKGETKISSPGGAISPPSAITMTPPSQHRSRADASAQLFSPERSVDDNKTMAPSAIPTSPLANASPGTKKKKLERLDWRLPKEDSMSDWTIFVKVSENVGSKDISTDVEDTYHVHKIVLSCGARQSEFFSQKLSEGVGFCRVELNPSAARAFPVMLDFIYNAASELNATTETGVALRYLSQIFGVHELKKKATTFIKKDFRASTAPCYFTEAHIFNEAKLRAAACTLCAASFDDIKSSDLLSLQPSLFVDVVSSSHFKARSDDFCIKVSDVLRANPGSANAELLSAVTANKKMPTIDAGESLFFIHLGLEHFLPMRSDPIEEPTLYERCIMSAANNWQSVVVRSLTENIKDGYQFNDLPAEVRLELFEASILAADKQTGKPQQMKVALTP